MGRYSRNLGTDFTITRCADDAFRIAWTCDRYHAGSRLRFPTRYSRIADLAGAKRFAKRHGISMPKVSK
jgi:hypothetical protein